MNTKCNQEKVKNIYYKSVRLLNDAQTQLDVIKRVLNKAVMNLTPASYNCDQRINDILDGMKLSVDDGNMDLLNEQLDDFLVLTDSLQGSEEPTHINDATASPKIKSMLTGLVNKLSLSNEASIKQQRNLLEEIDNSKDTDDSWGNVTEKVGMLINENIEYLQKNNMDLQAFIFKINEQLADIKAFMEQTRQDRKDTAELSSVLEESVGASVCNIQDKISAANNIDDLKNNISEDLDKIRKQVKDNKIAAEEKEEVSSQTFSKVVNELDSTQGELTKLKLQLETTKSQLLRDSLTELYNRVAYEDRVELEVSRCKRTQAPLSIAMWDIDYFKNINDSYGHDVGDRVLKAFAKLIQSRIRKTDMFARIGGEEFVLLMPDTTIQLALSLNDKLRKQFSECKFSYNDNIFFVTSSVGIAGYCDGNSPQDILKSADLALYESKDMGRNCCTIFKDSRS